MPRWLWALIILVLFFGFVLPDPAAAGAKVGEMINAVIIFFKSLGTAVTT